MRVLSIDPGYGRIGIAVLERQQGKDTLLFSECFETDKKAVFSDRLVSIGKRLSSVIAEHSPDALAIETLLFNTNQKTALQVSEARGVIVYHARAAGLSIYEYTPLQIKNAVCGYGKAPKDQVALMTQKLIHIPHEITHDDEMDAIATGITCLASTRNIA